MSNSLGPQGLLPTRLLYPWDFSGKNTGVDCHFFFQGIFPNQGLKCCLLGRWILYHSATWETPIIYLVDYKIICSIYHCQSLSFKVKLPSLSLTGLSLISMALYTVCFSETNLVLFLSLVFAYFTNIINHFCPVWNERQC